MGRKLVTIPLFLLLSSCMICLTFSAQLDIRTTDAHLARNLNTRLNYTTIQAAINAIDTKDGHRIMVDGDYIYYEHVIVNKSISLFGPEGRTAIIDGNGTGTAVTITKGNVNITELTIQNSSGYPYAGIYLKNASHCNMAGNTILSNYNGIDLNSSSYNTISGNTVAANTWFGIRLYGSSFNNTISSNDVTSNYYGISLYAGSYNNTVFGNNAAYNYNGIHLYSSSNNTISENTATRNHEYGICLFASVNNTIFENNATVNSWDGIRLHSSLYNTISKNTITTNHEFGIHFEWYSCNNTISENDITNNWDGIDLWDCSNNTILGNTITASLDDSICLNNSHYNNIVGNNVTNSDFGIILNVSSDNFICSNNFVDNLCQVFSRNSVNSWNGSYSYGGNFWSDYTDIDENKGPDQDEPGSDGIWDHPYVIDENNVDHYPKIPEFSLSLIPLTFMAATLLVAIARKRKQTVRERRSAS